MADEKMLHHVLTNTFRHLSFRPGQKNIIKAICAGNDVFDIQATGSGKSLKYQLSAVVSFRETKRVTIVVSPLLALAADQVRQLGEIGVPVVSVTSTSKTSKDEALDQVMSDKVCLLYTTPETLTREWGQEFITTLVEAGKLARIVIDEAHSVSQWGHDFRPSYVALGEIKKTHPKVPILACTATAPPRVRRDVIKCLGMRNVVRFSGDLNRTNLFLEVLRGVAPKQRAAHIAKEIKSRFRDQTGIVYCFSKKDCEAVAKHLTISGISAKAYHAGIKKPGKRAAIQREWDEGKTLVVVATTAFGMGINKGDVRFVIHHKMARSMTQLYQQAGRAGRDGHPSTSLVYFKSGDQYRMFANTAKEKTEVDEVKEYCYARSCRRSLLLKAIGEEFDSRECDGTCDNCARSPSRGTKRRKKTVIK
jgi:RecQ family ATP-dependent DNA helicase